MMNISQIKQIAVVESWVDTSGQILEIKESKNRTKKNRLMTKVTIGDETEQIGAWIYTDNVGVTPNQMVTIRGMLKEYKDFKYIDYAEIKNQTAPEAPKTQPTQNNSTPQNVHQAPQNAPQSTNNKQRDREKCICRQTAGKCIAESGPLPSELAPLELASWIIKAARPLAEWFYSGQEPDNTESEEDIPF